MPSILEDILIRDIHTRDPSGPHKTHMKPIKENHLPDVGSHSYSWGGRSRIEPNIHRGLTLHACLSRLHRSPCPSIGGPWNTPNRSYITNTGTPVHPKLRPYHIISYHIIYIYTFKAENHALISMSCISYTFS